MISFVIVSLNNRDPAPSGGTSSYLCMERDHGMSAHLAAEIHYYQEGEMNSCMVLSIGTNGLMTFINLSLLVRVLGARGKMF